MGKATSLLISNWVLAQRNMKDREPVCLRRKFVILEISPCLHWMLLEGNKNNYKFCVPCAIFYMFSCKFMYFELCLGLPCSWRISCLFGNLTV